MVPGRAPGAGTGDPVPHEPSQEDLPASGTREAFPDDDQAWVIIGWEREDWQDEYWGGPDSGCPPELAGISAAELIAEAEADADTAAQAAETVPEFLGAGFLPRSIRARSRRPYRVT